MIGRLLGVDYGTVRVGLSVCDPDRKIASPLGILQRETPARDALDFQRIVRDEAIVGIVIGVPVHTTGREGVKAHEARQYAAWLESVTKLPIYFADERFTTSEAESALWNAGLTHKQRKARRDAVAAQVLLQSYLDVGCPPTMDLGPLDG